MDSRNHSADWRNPNRGIINISNFQFLTDFMNSIIMSADLLDARESFKENRVLLEQMILLILENRKENSDESL